jgi:hypothetical protein
LDNLYGNRIIQQPYQYKMTSQLIENNIQELPLEIQSIIFYFIPTVGIAKIMRQVINMYPIDRKYTKRYNMYYIKDTLSFADYMCDSYWNPDDYEFGPLYVAT